MTKMTINGHEVEFDIHPADHSVGILFPFCETLSVDGVEIDEEQEKSKFMYWEAEVFSRINAQQAEAEKRMGL